MNLGGLCEACINPGQCCQDLGLSNSKGGFTTWADEDPAQALTDTIGQHWFVPLREVGRWADDDGREYVEHRWRCTALNGAGRCSVYDKRPELCRSYTPGQDGICAHSWSLLESHTE